MLNEALIKMVLSNLGINAEDMKAKALAFTADFKKKVDDVDAIMQRHERMLQAICGKLDIQLPAPEPTHEQPAITDQSDIGPTTGTA